MSTSPASASVKLLPGSVKAKPTPCVAAWAAIGPASTGASLTGVTVMPLLAVALLKALLPPLTLVSAVPPALPLPMLWSQARKVSPAASVPFQLLLGTKRTALFVSAASNRAEASLTTPKALQLVPSVVYCQTPLASFAPVTAMPACAAVSTSLIRPAISVATSVPGLLTVSSVIDARLLAPPSTGASLNACTLSVMLRVPLSAMPSLTVSVTVRGAVLGASLVLT